MCQIFIQGVDLEGSYEDQTICGSNSKEWIQKIYCLAFKKLRGLYSAKLETES